MPQVYYNASTFLTSLHQPSREHNIFHQSYPFRSCFCCSYFHITLIIVLLQLSHWEDDAWQVSKPMLFPFKSIILYINLISFVSTFSYWPIIDVPLLIIWYPAFIHIVVFVTMYIHCSPITYVAVVMDSVTFPSVILIVSSRPP